MSFSFNFLDSADIAGPTEHDAEPSEQEAVQKEEEATDAPSKRLPFGWIPNLPTLLEERRQEELVFTELAVAELKCVDGSLSSFVKAESPSLPDNTDIVNGLYEGGGKVWECSLDLVSYLAEHSIHLKDDQRALELGCGHALPGLYLLKEALAHQTNHCEIVLTDYNECVLLDATLSNLVLNTQLPGKEVIQVSELCQYVRLGAGDWMDMSQQLGDETFAIILAAETLYSESAARDTAVFLSRHLRGTAYLATKRYYFGVGGGVDSFREAVASLDDHGLKVETVQVIDNGSSNIREILKVTSK